MGFLDKLFNWGKKKEPPKSPEGPGGQSLTDITRGMQHAVNRTQEILERHYLEQLDRYFETDEDGKQYPKMVTFKIDGADMHVPMVSLIPPGGLALKKMQVKMAVRIDKADIKKAGPQAHHEKDHLTRTSFQVSFASIKATEGEKRDMNAIEVTMDFVAGEAPEGVSRILEQYINSIKPTDRKDPPPEGVTQLSNGGPPKSSGDGTDVATTTTGEPVETGAADHEEPEERPERRGGGTGEPLDPPLGPPDEERNDKP
jgi:hypothetical protein